ncbi:hypothetical protein E0Z10_g9628 [Xylaria hypoxylon]|uniref:Fungal N-terminal domain-containing protein n=1 Tax=Xylaria hypoxylon TaxID=37992 RepID=A0A4Z0YNF3_9PEZI|nr:hypothetical protein E0Z10_g9628 [Xylaria hypoxylon]
MGLFTLAQTISALQNASSEVKGATKFLATVQAQIEYTKGLRDQAFDVTNPDTSKDEVFNRVQTALQNIININTECSNTLKCSTKSVTKKEKDGTQHTTTKTRFKWVLGGKSTYNAKLQEMNFHHQTLMHATDALQRKWADMGGHSPLAPSALPFGAFELFTADDNTYLNPGHRRDGISRHLSPRQSIVMLDEASDSDDEPSNRDSGIGLRIGIDSSEDVIDSQGQ